MDTESFEIAFLGFAEKAAHVRDSSTNLYKWNVLGLKQNIVSNLFPISFNFGYLGFASRGPVSDMNFSLVVKKEDGKEIGCMNFETAEMNEGSASVGTHSESPSIFVPLQGWAIGFIPLPTDTTVIIPEPGLYLILVRRNEVDKVIGQLSFLLLDPQPLTPEKIAAIRTDPSALNRVTANFKCTKCQSEINAYASLERDHETTSEDCIWYEDLPNEFQCECRTASFDLRIMKRNLFAPLGQPMPRPEKQMGLVPLYEKGSIDSILIDFRTLLKSKPREEELQKFIQDNPILLHQFPAEKLFFKPPILTSFEADFGIVTPQKELILIEIEKGTTRLLTKSGGQAAPLRHAFDQVHSWLHIVDEHRLAVLDSLKIDRSTVSTIRGVVIAGRDAGYDAEHLRRLKGIDHGRTKFLTYDDLAFGLESLLSKI